MRRVGGRILSQGNFSLPGPRGDPSGCGQPWSAVCLVSFVLVFRVSLPRSVVLSVLFCYRLVVVGVLLLLGFACGSRF